jgi:hypothetical protein
MFWSTGRHLLFCGAALVLVSVIAVSLLQPTSSKAASGKILWSADMETGDLSQWYAPAKEAGHGNGGGVYNSGYATAEASQDYAHSGKWSAKLTITTPGPNGGSSGARLFRWKESRDPAYLDSGLYYGAWFYLPKQYRLTGDPHKGKFFNLFQFKSKHGANVVDPTLYIDVQNRPNGAMYPTLYWWNGLKMEGPHPGQFGGKRFEQTSADLPVGKWVHIEVFLRQAGDFSGRITVWQDGVQIFDEDQTRTRYPDGDNQWAVNLYSDALSPNPSTIYIDDATISTYRVGP